MKACQKGAVIILKRARVVDHTLGDGKHGQMLGDPRHDGFAEPIHPKGADAAKQKIGVRKQRVKLLKIVKTDTGWPPIRCFCPRLFSA